MDKATGVEDSLARVFFHKDSEAAINEQINHELTMSYNYDAVSSLHPAVHFMGLRVMHTHLGSFICESTKLQMRLC